MSASEAAAAGALRLRAWALRVLGGGAAGPPPAADEAAWRVFLAIDRCALPLRGAGAGAPGLDGAALEQTRRVLAARAVAVDLGRLLSARGWTGVVLKGGASLLGGGTPVDVLDVDVLVRPAQAAPLAEALDAEGYVREKVDVLPGQPNRYELAPRRSPGGMHVEVHYDVAEVGKDTDPWAGIAPLPIPGLARMAPAAHLWHVLVHGALHHPERRGALRDLLVAADAARRCSAEELEGVRARIRAHPRGAVPGRMLEMASALAAGGVVEDRFRREAATAYLLYLHVRRRQPREHFLLPLARVAFAAAGGERGEYARLWAGAPVSVLSRGYAGDHWLDRRVPAAAMVGRVLHRGAYLAAATLPALRLARAARRLAEAAPGE